MGLRVVAEGVETEDMASRLRMAGCDLLQGYCFGRPMPADEFLDWLRAWHMEPESHRDAG